jgi:hypothetical protein
MGWTIKIEDENGNEVKVMPSEFRLSDPEILNNSSFKLLKYVDPYGDTSFNSFMFNDLIEDLGNLVKLSPLDYDKINEVIKYAQECQNNVHTYLKFYGD